MSQARATLLVLVLFMEVIITLTLHYSIRTGRKHFVWQHSRLSQLAGSYNVYVSGHSRCLFPGFQGHPIHVTVQVPTINFAFIGPQAYRLETPGVSSASEALELSARFTINPTVLAKSLKNMADFHPRSRRNPSCKRRSSHGSYPLKYSSYYTAAHHTATCSEARFRMSAQRAPQLPWR